MSGMLTKHRDLKGKKNKFRDLGKMVKNTQAVQVWILPGHKYKTIFTGKWSDQLPHSMRLDCSLAISGTLEAFVMKGVIAEVPIRNSNEPLIRQLMMLGLEIWRLKPRDN
jgi:hypothetical protein